MWLLPGVLQRDEVAKATRRAEGDRRRTPIRGFPAHLHLRTDG